jgi:hypothetical protein
MAPNQHPDKFIAATLMPTAVTLGEGKSGSKSEASALTAMTELSVVRGSCAMPMPIALELQFGKLK